MACTLPVEPTDGQLLAYSEGDGDPLLNAHIDRCPACLARAEALAQATGRLNRLLYRLQCPTSLTLGEYRLALLDHATTGTVAEHVAICPHCAAELVTLDEFVADLATDLPLVHSARAPARPFHERVQRYVAELLEQLPRGDQLGLLTPALSGLRGNSEDTSQQIYTVANGIQIIIDSQPDTEVGDHRVLLGLVIGLPVPEEAFVSFWQDERLLASTQVNALGNFVFNALPTGHYQLIFSNSEMEIEIPTVQL